MGGNFVVRDGFQPEKLDIAWEFLRTPHEQWYTLVNPKGHLVLRVRPEICSGKANPSFLARRQQHAVGSATVSINFLPQGENEKAGLVIFQNERRYYYLCKSLEGSRPVIQVYRSADESTPGDTMQLLASHAIDQKVAAGSLLLKIEAHGSTYSFHYAVDQDEWIALEENVDAKYLSTKDAGGFVGCMYALYATSLGKPSQSTASYDWYEYVGNDEVYR
jgi:alpha-N-arabinofuranosidase